MIHARIDKEWTRRGFGLWLFDYRDHGSYVAAPMELDFKPIKEAERLPAPTIFLPDNMAAQTLRAIQDALFEANIQSTRRIERGHELEAVKAHLADSVKVRDTLLRMIEGGP